MQSTIKRILDKLEGVRSNEKGWQAKCPAHDDAIASLSAGVGEDGRVLLHCHAGCNVADICEAIGLEKKDLFHAGSLLLTITVMSKAIFCFKRSARSPRNSFSDDQMEAGVGVTI